MRVMMRIRAGGLRLAAIATVATLLVVEAALRVGVEPPGPVNDPARHILYLGRPDPRLPTYREVYPLTDDRRGYYRGSGGAIDYYFDAWGGRWRWPEARAARGRGVLVVGDSFTLGFGLRYVDSYVYQLEQLLGDRFHFINLAEPGADAMRCRAIYAARAGGLPHEVLLYGLNPNDLIRFVTSYFATVEPVPTLLDPLRPHVRLLDFVCGRLERTADRRRKIAWLTSPAAQQTLYFERNMAAIEAMRDASRARGACFGVALLPLLVDVHRGTFASTYDAIAAALEARGVPVIDLSRAIDARRDEDLWILPFDQHPNEIAHAAFARRLAAGWDEAFPGNRPFAPR